MPFPTQPTNGQTYDAGVYQYTYNAKKKLWIKTGFANAPALEEEDPPPPVYNIQIRTKDK